MNAQEAADRRIMILRARSLRRNATDAEKLLWSALRDRRLERIRFRRQVVIGRYVADFCAANPKLVIELDGVQHEQQTSYDGGVRSRYLEDGGYFVMRFWNGEVVTNLRGVLDTIGEEIRKRSVKLE
jgi:very-short-patch-repair endonuclease